MQAVDSSIEQLGQTFELKFYAPLTAGMPQTVPAVLLVCGVACQLQVTFAIPGCLPCLRAGKYDLQLLGMPDAWLGCDRAIPIKLKVGYVALQSWHALCVLRLSIWACIMLTLARHHAAKMSFSYESVSGGATHTSGP